MGDLYGRGGIHLPTDLLAALATSDFRLWIYGLRSLYGVTRFLHLVGMAGFFGMILLIQVMSIGLFPGASIQSARLPVVKLLNSTFALTLVTGILLFLYDPLGVGLHTMFLPKLILIGLGLVQAYWLQRLPTVQRSAGARRVSAGAALALWVLVIGASTWNHVERPFNPADIHRADPRDH